MTALDNVNKQQFFHGTSDIHEPGDIIDPSVPHRSNFGHESREDRIYMADTNPSRHNLNGLEHAKHYADKDANAMGRSEGRVYEVQPTEEPFPVMNGKNTYPGAWQSDKPVRVKREAWRG